MPSNAKFNLTCRLGKNTCWLIRSMLEHTLTRLPKNSMSYRQEKGNDHTAGGPGQIRGIWAIEYDMCMYEILYKKDLKN